MKDATVFAVLRRVLAGFSLATDTRRGLDEALSTLLAALSGLPGLTAAVVVNDAEGQPAVRASLGTPDMGLVLSAALERGPEAVRARVLRRGEAPVVAGDDGGVAASREEAAMLAAPIVAGGGHLGWFCLCPPLGPGEDLTEDVRLAVLVADTIAAVVGTAGQAAEARLDMVRELAFLRSKVSLRYEHVFFTGQSTLLATLRGETDKAALSEAPVLLRGEPGTGRTVLARLIHELSPRALRPFLTCDVAEAGPTLAARLCGDTRSLGATGGPGLLEEADGGTLCLANAHVLPPEVAGLLERALSTGVFTRLGGGRERRLGVRLIFTTPAQGLSPDLAVAANPLVLRLPSLRQRREDIAALLAHFLDAEAARGGRRLTLTSKVLRTLEAYDWPGNIRELEHTVSRLVATAPEDRVDMADIPPEMLAEGERPQELPEDAAELRDMERQQVLSALERHGWVQSRAARELGLTLRQIGYRIRKYGLAREGE